MDVIINTEGNPIFRNSKMLNSQGLAELNLLACCGYNPANPPFGDLLKSIHSLEGDWIILSPMHWQASHNDAMIVAIDKDLQLSDEEAKHWFNLYSDYLTDEGLCLYYHDAFTWLLRTDNKPLITAKPVHLMLNKSLMAQLSQLDSTMYWQRFVTESQMFFASQHQISPINGVWAWGSAKLMAKKTISICTDKHFFSIAQVCSSNVTLYNPLLSLHEFQIVLLNDIGTLSESHQNEIKKIYAHWYWKNCAYTSAKYNWFIRFWRRLTHAD